MDEIIVPPGETPKKLENFLKKRFPIGYVRRLLRKNGVRINGQRPKTESVVGPGDRIQLYLRFAKTPRSPATGALAHPPIETLFEDKDLIVINKPAGLAVHEGKNILKRNSIIGILEVKYRGANIIPALVHRLDKDTSGLLILAKNERTAEELQTAFGQGNVHKEYLCLVTGRLEQDSGRIDFPLAGREGKAVSTLTRFKVERRFSEATLVRVYMETGRMHQIRLHFSSLGHPVVMDDQHGDFEFNRRFRKRYGLRRQFLHACAATVHFRGAKHTWNAPLPEDLQRTLDALEKSTRPE